MQITIETESYNERRYSKPWIAKVNFSESVKGNFSWGDWAGDHYNGSNGVLSINVNPGDIVATGQKDFRKSRNSTPEFYVVNSNGELDRLGNKGDAYKYYLENKDIAPDLDALRAERNALVTRISEIDEVLNK